MAGHYAGNERVSTPFGPGTVNGVANGNVVVYLDEGRMVELADRELTPLAEVIDVPAAVEDPFTDESQDESQGGADPFDFDLQPEDVDLEQAAAKRQAKSKSA